MDAELPWLSKEEGQLHARTLRSHRDLKLARFAWGSTIACLPTEMAHNEHKNLMARRSSLSETLPTHESSLRVASTAVDSTRLLVLKLLLEDDDHEYREYHHRTSQSPCEWWQGALPRCATRRCRGAPAHRYMPSIKLGNCAVDMFFVLSSFLLTWLFYKKSEQLLAQQASYRRWGLFLLDYLSKR